MVQSTTEGFLHSTNVYYTSSGWRVVGRGGRKASVIETRERYGIEPGSARQKGTLNSRWEKAFCRGKEGAVY